MDPEYGHHINPISRLIQVMQARQQREPVFQLLAEQGQNRHKEFTVEVRCMELREQGIGPNKKLAKRAAAEAMLARIGYVKVSHREEGFGAVLCQLRLQLQLRSWSRS